MIFIRYTSAGTVGFVFCLHTHTEKVRFYVQETHFLRILHIRLSTDRLNCYESKTFSMLLKPACQFGEPFFVSLSAIKINLPSVLPPYQ